MAKRILVVDDEKNLVRLVQVILEQAGYEVDKAYDGKEALDRIVESRPDLVLMDVMMPVMDGFEALAALRKSLNPRLRNVPVIMLTAQSRREDLEYGLYTGADLYVTKPTSPEELLGIVVRFFRDRETTEGKSLCSEN